MLLSGLLELQKSKHMNEFRFETIKFLCNAESHNPNISKEEISHPKNLQLNSNIVTLRADKSDFVIVLIVIDYIPKFNFLLQDQSYSPDVRDSSSKI